jgi:hypothetical protein
MTTLYRSPTLIIDRHEWHVAVVKHYGRAAVRYCWRPLSARAERWQPISAWEGPKPKRIGDAFWRFRGHVREAMNSEQARRDALAGAGRPVLVGTPRRRPGRKDPHHHGLGLASGIAA